MRDLSTPNLESGCQSEQTSLPRPDTFLELGGVGISEKTGMLCLGLGWQPLELGSVLGGGAVVILVYVVPGTVTPATASGGGERLRAADSDLESWVQFPSPLSSTT